jgi:hypothetical protein
MAVMIPRPSPATQWITAPFTRRHMLRSYASCACFFRSGLPASAMPGARAVAKYSPRPSTDKNRTMMGHPHLIAFLGGVLVPIRSIVTYTAPASPTRYQGITNQGSARKDSAFHIDPPPVQHGGVTALGGHAGPGRRGSVPAERNRRVRPRRTTAV